MIILFGIVERRGFHFPDQDHNVQGILKIVFLFWRVNPRNPCSVGVVGLGVGARFANTLNSFVPLGRFACGPWLLGD